MRVLIVNTSENTGGAAVASNRLLAALNNNGVKAKMLVRDKETDRLTVVGLPSRWRQQWNFLWERWCIFVHLHFSRKHLFDIDIANMGTDITSLPEFKEADVVHLEWINQGMLSLKNIRKIIASGKPVVWTMHDLWPAAAICHYARGCNAYKTGCHSCKLLPGGGSAHDLAYKIWQRKKNTYAHGNIVFVACSHWLEGLAKESRLLEGQHVTSVPNAIDTNIFCKKDKREARMQAELPQDKRIILFVSQRVTDERKGMRYFIEAIDHLTMAHPELKEQAVVAVLGAHAEELGKQLTSLPMHQLGYVSDAKRIADIYNAADVYVLPSLEDNLPNTIMEASACGVPCVGFKVGGIPEMIDHQKSGYVAKFRDAVDLANGMSWVLQEADYEALSRACVHKVAINYSQASVSLKYIEVYNQAIALKNYIK